MNEGDTSTSSSISVPLCQYTNRHFSAFKPYLPSHQSVITEIDFPWSILDFESSFKVVLES